MRKSLSALLMLAAILVPAWASAHPPAADVQNACQGLPAVAGEPSPTVQVPQVLSYVAPPGFSLPQCRNTPGEWGSHAPPCAGVLVVGPSAGAYCGPLVPPGGTATCTWAPVANRLELVGLVIGFDNFLWDGRISLTASGEGPVTKPLPPGAWTVTNPSGLPARVIAYPTNAALPPHPQFAALDPTAVNQVVCVTP